MKGWVYILKCADETYYTGSTNNIILRLHQHETGIGSNYTAKRLPVELVYFKEFEKVSQAFYREKQIQGWSRRKKEALINDDLDSLTWFSVCYKEFYNAVLGSNNRYKTKELKSIQSIQLLGYDDELISEMIEYIYELKKIHP